jgi:type IV pilus assembly protein PilV
MMMMKPFRSRSSNAGFSMVEVLVSLLITALGLLGLAGLQVRMQQAEFESYQRSQALILLYDMTERIESHRVAARSCFAAITTNTTNGTPYLGTGANAPTGCASGGTAADNARADAAIAEWDSLLDGASETKGGASVGSIVGARGCVSYNAASELAGQPGTGMYTVMVAWQGQFSTAIPTKEDGTTLHCADNQYGNETLRRVVYTTFRLAKLN